MDEQWCDGAVERTRMIGVTMNDGGEHGAEAQTRHGALHMGLVHAFDRTVNLTLWTFKLFFQL